MGGKGQSEEYVLSEAQLQKLWNACYEITDKVLVGLLAFCGMRVSEATHLKLDWIREQAIHIPSSMPCNCNDYMCRKRGSLWKPKTKKGARVVPIPGFLKSILAIYLQQHPDGLQMSRQGAWYRVVWLAAKAKIPKTFPHSLRASYATMLASKGMEAMAICYLLGWSRLDVAQHYIRIARAKDIAKKQIEDIWG